ncbi:hypothetical protein Tco_1162853 [Tanacetum coccineum]
MSSITAQQTKLDLELVPKENRLDIGKCNGIIPRGLTPREPTFQVVLDAITLTLCYPIFLITADVPKVYMHQFWNYVYKHDTFYRFKLDKKKRFKLTLEVFRDIFLICPRVQGRDFDALPSEEDIVSFLRELDHTREINSLNDVVVDQIPEMKNSKAYKTYLGYAIGVVPPKIARKFKKSYPSKKDTAGIVIRESLVETKSKRKEKEKVDVAHGKGIELLSDVALTEEAQMKEVRMKSLREFHKTHPSGSGTVAKKPPRVEKITHTVTGEGTGDKLEVPDVTKDDSTESESESWGNDKDDSNKEQESSNESKNESEEHESDYEQEEEVKDDDNLESISDDVIQNKGADAQQGNENIVTTQEQVVDDAHVMIFIVTTKTKDIPHADAEIVSPLDVHVHHEVPRTHAPTLLTVPVLVITDSSPVYTDIPQLSQTFTPPPPLATPTPPPTIATTNPLSTLLILHRSFDSTIESQHWKKKLLNLKRTLYILK